MSGFASLDPTDIVRTVLIQLNPGFTTHTFSILGLLWLCPASDAY